MSPADRHRIPCKRCRGVVFPQTPPRADGTAQVPRQQQLLLVRRSPYAGLPLLDDAAHLPWRQQPFHAQQVATPTKRPPCTASPRLNDAAHFSWWQKPLLVPRGTTPTEQGTTPTERPPYAVLPWLDEAVLQGTTPSQGRMGGGWLHLILSRLEGSMGGFKDKGK
jgi:hypothetical protein